MDVNGITEEASYQGECEGIGSLFWKTFPEGHGRDCGHPVWGGRRGGAFPRDGKRATAAVPVFYVSDAFAVRMRLVLRGGAQRAALF